MLSSQAEDIESSRRPLEHLGAASQADESPVVGRRSSASASASASDVGEAEKSSDGYLRVFRSVNETNKFLERISQCHLFKPYR